MFSLSAIPEPSNNAPRTDALDAPQIPLASTADEGRLASTPPTDQAEPQQDAEQQIDGAAVVLVLLVAGALLRLVLTLLGPMQGINPTPIEQALQHGKQILTGDSNDVWPLFDLMSYGWASIGLPAWAFILLGSLVTLACVPAAYFIGQTLTGRRAAGILAAAMVAVHPAVLTASNHYASPAIAMGLVTIGLACVCLVERKGNQAALFGAVILGAAGLAAPLTWVVGILAGPLTYKLARRKGAIKSLALSTAVVLIATAPVAGYRIGYLGFSTNAMWSEWNIPPNAFQKTTPIEYLLVTMTHTSFAELSETMHLPIKNAGRLKLESAMPTAEGERDVIADILADGWLVINAALAGLASVSVGVMLARRRFAETLILTVPLLGMSITSLPPGETLRLPMLALVGILAVGLLSTHSPSRIDKAAQQAKHAAKRAKREESERAKQEREVARHKQSLYAFDKPAKPKHAKSETAEQSTSLTPTPMPTQKDEAVPVPTGRPI